MSPPPLFSFFCILEESGNWENPTFRASRFAQLKRGNPEKSASAHAQCAETGNLIFEMQEKFDKC